MFLFKIIKDPWQLSTINLVHIIESLQQIIGWDVKVILLTWHTLFLIRNLLI
jgi:hypothetical protein